MEQITTTQQLDNAIENNPLVLIYFSGKKCSVCHSLQPKIEDLVNSQFSTVKMVVIPTDESPELVGRFRMFSVPAVLLFIEGREYIREIRNVSIPDLTQKIGKIVSLYSE